MEEGRQLLLSLHPNQTNKSTGIELVNYASLVVDSLDMEPASPPLGFGGSRS